MDFQALLAEGWIQSAEWFASIDSTNSFLKREYSISASDENEEDLFQRLPRLIVSDHQTAGRGRGDHAWWSPIGCLMLSVAFTNPTPIAQSLPFLVAIAIAKTIESEIEDPLRCRIKWPNDIFVDDSKIAGSLIENILYRSRSLFIVGTGINVDVDFTHAPEEVRKRAIALREVSRSAISQAWDLQNQMQQTLNKFIAELQNAVFEFNRNPTWWHTEWVDRCYLTGKNIEGIVSIWESGDGCELEAGLNAGYCLGLDRNGHLRIRHESGKIGRIVSGSVRIL